MACDVVYLPSHPFARNCLQGLQTSMPSCRSLSCQHNVCEVTRPLTSETDIHELHQSCICLFNLCAVAHPPVMNENLGKKQCTECGLHKYYFDFWRANQEEYSRCAACKVGLALGSYLLLE